MTARPGPPQAGPYSVLLTGGEAGVLAGQLAALGRQTMRPAEAWILQPDHDPAAVALADANASPAVRVIRQDLAPPRWAPLVFAWFMPDSYTLLLAPGVRPAPHFAETALMAMRRQRAVICPHGRRGGNPVPPGAEDQTVDAGADGWFFETHWIRHAWARAPADLDGDAMAAFTLALRRAGVPFAVPALPAGVGDHLLG